MDRWVDRLFLNNLIFSTEIMPKQWRVICLEEMRADIYWVSAETETGQDNMYHLYAHMYKKYMNVCIHVLYRHLVSKYK